MTRKPTSTGKFKCAKCLGNFPRASEESKHTPGFCWSCCPVEFQPLRKPVFRGNRIPEHLSRAKRAEFRARMPQDAI